MTPDDPDSVSYVLEALTNCSRWSCRGALSPRGSPAVYPIIPRVDILSTVTKRLIDIDDDLLEKVRSLIGASTMKEAVNGALQHVVDFELRLQHVRRLMTLEGMDLADQQVMRDAWR